MLQKWGLIHFKSFFGKVSLYGWAPVFQVCIQLLRYFQKHIFCCLVKLDTNCTVISTLIGC